MEFVIVVERWTDNAGHPIDVPTNRHYVALAMSYQLCLGKPVDRGEWALRREEGLAFVFSDFKKAKRLAKTAAVMGWATEKKGYRAAIRMVLPRPRNGTRLSLAFVGPELWPKPQDPVTALAVLA